MIKENRLILEVCKEKYANKEVLEELLEEQMDYSYVLGHLLINRVGAIAYCTLKDNQLLHRVSREFRNTLKNVYEYNLIKNNSFINALKMLNTICSKLEFPYALLKGAYLLELYERGQRTSNDIDILIPSNHITMLSNELKRAGFEQGNISNEAFVPASRTEIISSRMNRGETVPFIKEVGLPGMRYLEIDVNFSLGFKPSIDDTVIDSFLERTQPLILDSILTLDRVDFLLHLCAHLFKEATVMSWVEMGRDISLYKYCDIFLFLQTFLDPLFTETLIDRIFELNLQKECYYSLKYTKELFEVENKNLDEVLSNIKPADTSFMTEVLDPKSQKLFSFGMPYKDYVFCSNRKGCLHET